MLKKIAKYGLNMIGGDYQVSALHPPPVFPRRFKASQVFVTPMSLEQYISNTTKPFYVARWGTTEFVTLKHLNGLLPWYEKKFNKNIKKEIARNSGFFSAYTPGAIEKYARLYQESLLDCTAFYPIGWLEREMDVLDFVYAHNQSNLAHVTIIDHNTVDRPWTNSARWVKYLAGKRVLVVSAFAKDIEEQYKKRSDLFPCADTIPRFDLLTYQTVQGIGDNPNLDPKFSNWFDALQMQINDIRNFDFDIALVSCGAYGLPICRDIYKNMGKSCVYVGGALQLFFGIRGKRWDLRPEYARIFNEHWIYPKTNVGALHTMHDADQYGRG